ncbi:MAG: hypothetical protein ACI4WX_02690, partial [Aristaeellaceae bacterium]
SRTSRAAISSITIAGWDTERLKKYSGTCPRDLHWKAQIASDRCFWSARFQRLRAFAFVSSQCPDIPARRRTFIIFRANRVSFCQSEVKRAKSQKVRHILQSA